MENNNFGERLVRLRKQAKLTQQALAEKINYSDKVISKWERGESYPDLIALKILANFYLLKLDDLVNNTEVDTPLKAQQLTDNKPISVMKNLLGIKGTQTKTKHGYEFKSEKTTKKGKPYVHINFGLDENGNLRLAKGVLAVGIIAKGIFSLGLISFGLISLGLLAFGLVAFGSFASGALLAIGGASVGIGVSIGGIAVGAVAVGGIAIGIFSVGGLSIGVWAHTGEFGKAIGRYVYYHTGKKF